METANAFRDWLKFHDKNALYGLTVSRAINKWDDDRKNLLKPLLKHLNTKSTKTVRDDIVTIYRNLVPAQTEDVDTPEGTYSNWQLLKSSVLCSVYTSTLTKKDGNSETAIVKTYLSIEKCHFARDDNVISKKLYEKGLNVPRRYESFETYHYLCIPMQKLDTTLLDMYALNPVGIGLQNVKLITYHFVKILEVLHKEHKRCYVDFSCGNVAFIQEEMEPYMIDFGALHLNCLGFTPSQKTERYCSINADKGLPVTFTDDLQSLGFLLTEALYGPYFTLNKSKIIAEATEGKLGAWLQSYFLVIQKEDPYESLIEICYS